MPQKSGKDELVLLRILGEKVDAEKVMLVTEHSRSTEKDKDSVETMDGSISAGGSLESEVKFTAHMDVQDKQLSDEIEDAVEDDIAYELWFINRQVKIQKENIKQNTDRVTSHRLNVRMRLMVSLNMKLNMLFSVRKNVVATLPKLIEDNKLAYGFHDTVKADPANDGLASIPQPTESGAAETGTPVL
ncbi:phage major tail protein, TP901-1 family [Staphylococcus lugdunensis]